jgi:hypothetical protein
MAGLCSAIFFFRLSCAVCVFALYDVVGEMGDAIDMAAD